MYCCMKYHVINIYHVKLTISVIILYHIVGYYCCAICYIFIKRLKTVLAEIIFNIKFVISFLSLPFCLEILDTFKCFVKKRPGYLKLLNDACTSFLCEDKCMNK